MQTIDNWLEWKKLCALGRCGRETARELPGFVHARFSRFVEAYVRTTNAGAPASATPSSGEAWHRFETHFCLHCGPGGKSYKEWLFANVSEDSGPTRETVEAGATLLIRDVVREYLRREYSGRNMVSANADAGTGEHSRLTLADLLPDDSDVLARVEDSELTRLAVEDAEEIFPQLDSRERIALFVHDAGLSLAHPDAVMAAGCSKSSLNNAFRKALTRIAGHTREKHSRECRNVLAALACRTHARMRHLILPWIRLEKSCTQLCKVAEAHRDELLRRD